MKYAVIYVLVVTAVFLPALQALELNSQTSEDHMLDSLSEDDMLDRWLDELTVSLEQVRLFYCRYY